jgi:hypothetical protein
MPASELLVARIRGEFREMPGLRLTFAQTCRLLQVDAATCDAVLQKLLADNVLVRTANGSFMALPTPQEAVKPSKAAIPPCGSTASRVRRSA